MARGLVAGMKHETEPDNSGRELPSLAEMIRVLACMAVAFLMMGMTCNKLGFMPALGMWGTWGLGIYVGRSIGLTQEKKARR